MRSANCSKSTVFATTQFVRTFICSTTTCSYVYATCRRPLTCNFLPDNFYYNLPYWNKYHPDYQWESKSLFFYGFQIQKSFFKNFDCQFLKVTKLEPVVTLIQLNAIFKLVVYDISEENIILFKKGEILAILLSNKHYFNFFFPKIQSVRGLYTDNPSSNMIQNFLNIKLRSKFGCRFFYSLFKVFWFSSQSILKIQQEKFFEKCYI